MKCCFLMVKAGKSEVVNLFYQFFGVCQDQPVRLLCLRWERVSFATKIASKSGNRDV